MKFCKNLQRVVDISDPEWAPYWTNYKMLKKLIKELPSLVPSDDSPNNITDKNPSVTSTDGSHTIIPETPTAIPSPSTLNEVKIPTSPGKKDGLQRLPAHVAMGKNPGEVAFFKLLHAELKKAIHFFERAENEFAIREERVREGMAIMKKPNSIMLVNDRWSVLAKSLYRLYKDLLLLETFAIMTYCSFSKILKKHDKVTGYETRNAFMTNVVNKANFTNYPRVLEMIQRCEALYTEVSELLVSEGKQSLYEDERLFISMIHRLNEQAMNTAEAEGAPEMSERKEKKWPKSESPVLKEDAVVQLKEPNADPDSASRASSIRTIVEDNESKVQPVQAEASEDDESRKRCALAVSIADATDCLNKRPRS